MNSILLRTYIENIRSYVKQYEGWIEHPKNLKIKEVPLLKKDQEQRGKQTSFRDHIHCNTSRTHGRGGISTWHNKDWNELVSMRNIKPCTEISFTHDGYYYPWLTELALFSVFHICASSSSWSLFSFSYWSCWHLKLIAATSKITILIPPNFTV